MDRLVSLADGVYYLPGFTNIGVLVNKEDVVVIDTGIDKSAAKKLLSAIRGLGSRFYIVNTHHHADHCGGNTYLVKSLNAKVYAPSVDEAFVRYPYLEPFSIFSGAFPLKELRGRFLMARPSPVDVVINPGALRVGGLDIKIVSLSGHSPNQIGVLYNGVLFCGDAVFPERIIEKYRIPFVVDVEAQIKTLGLLLEPKCNIYLPAHGDPMDDISDIVRLNRDVVDDIIRTILDMLSKKLTTEEVIRMLCDHYEVKTVAATGYYLIRTTIMAYLSYLCEKGKVSVDFSENVPYWSLR